MNKRLLATSIVALLVGLGTYRYATMPDHLVRVIDGDTIIINHGTHVRLWGIDAPELDQLCTRDNGALKVNWHCGQVSRDYLKSMLALKVDLVCDAQAGSSYGRSIAICYTINTAGQKHDIARSLVAAGWAVDYPRYSNLYYLTEQDYAKRNKLGVWSGAFELPWDWRKAHR